MKCSTPGCEIERYHWSRERCLLHDVEERALRDALDNALHNAREQRDAMGSEILRRIANRQPPPDELFLDEFRALWHRHHTLHTLHTNRRPGDPLPGDVALTGEK